MFMGKLKIEEVVEAAGRTVIGTPSGLVSQQAQAELTKRLIDSNESLRKATEENNTPSDMSWPLRIGVALAPVVVIYVGLKYK